VPRRPRGAGRRGDPRRRAARRDRAGARGLGRAPHRGGGAAEELAARTAEAEAEVTRLSEAPEEAAARLAAAGRALAEAEATHKAAARTLAIAEHELREASSARRDADARFAAAREAQVRTTPRGRARRPRR
jgi:chromosome segregation protein